jgi:transcriptional regulator with XRE-family HTH domain
MSSTELTKKAGVRIAYLSEIEHDRTKRPEEDFLEKLADALGVPLETILGRQMPPKDGEVGGISSVQPGDGKAGSQKGVSASTVLHAPLVQKNQKLLMHQIGMLEKKVEALEKNLCTVKEDLRELGALAKAMFVEEKDRAQTPSTSSV